MFSELIRKFAKIGWFLPGFLLWAAFPPMGEKTDVLFALAPLIWLSRRADARSSAKRWFMSGAFFWVATLAWMPAIVKNGGPWPLVVLGWFALAAYCAAYFAAYGWLSASYWRWARQSDSYLFRLLGILVVEPVLWCGLELIRSRFLGGFAWNQLGVVPANGGFGAPAALGGVYLLSAIVFLINGTFAGIAERVWKPERSGFSNLRRWGTVETILAFGFVFGIYWGGVGSEDAAETQSSTTVADATSASLPQTSHTSPVSIKVALVQRNFPCVFKTREENPVAVYGKLLENVALLKPDLVVFAESAMCEFGPVDQQGAVRFAQWVQEKTGGAVLAGGTRYVEEDTYNSAALYQFLRSVADATSASLPQTSQPSINSQTSNFKLQTTLILSFYDKVHLVPFGEFIPGDKLIPALQKLAPVGSCTPGEPKLLSLLLPCGGVGGEGAAETGAGRPRPGVGGEGAAETGEGRPRPDGEGQAAAEIPFGVAICFEDTDSALMRRYAAMGARFLCFITNDSWFSHSNESVQHAWQATARAIETGLPVVRVGNSGVSGTVMPDGKASWLIGPDGRELVDCRGTMFDRLTLADGTRRTPYVTVGDSPLFVAFALLILTMILVKYKSYYEKRRKLSL